jgi:lysophospholipase L1-like esterase
VAKERVASRPEKIRLVLLGDSLACGTGDESGRGLSGGLKDELRARGVGSVESTNLCANGATTDDLAARLRQDRVRSRIAESDVIVLSIGANDLFRTQRSREETLRAPLVVADQILSRLEALVIQLRAINPTARILILGGYNPVPQHPMARLINTYLAVWDAGLGQRFEHDPLVSVVALRDILDRADRLSRFDNFHPGKDAYRETARRIAAMLVQEKG